MFVEQLGSSWLQKELEELKKELLSKNKPEIENLKILSFSLLQNMRKLLLKRTLRVWLGKHLITSLWDCMSRNTASLNWRGQRWGKMKNGCWTSWIWQDGIWSCVAVNMHYSSRTGRNDPKGDSEVIRATASVSTSLRHLLGAFGDGTPQNLRGRGHPTDS